MTSHQVLPHLVETESATTRYLQALTVLGDEALREPARRSGARGQGHRRRPRLVGARTRWRPRT